jgi:hypothetical protein
MEARRLIPVFLRQAHKLARWRNELASKERKVWAREQKIEATPALLREGSERAIQMREASAKLR